MFCKASDAQTVLQRLGFAFFRASKYEMDAETSQGDLFEGSQQDEAADEAEDRSVLEFSEEDMEGTSAEGAN